MKSTLLAVHEQRGLRDPCPEIPRCHAPLATPSPMVFHRVFSIYLKSLFHFHPSNEVLRDLLISIDIWEKNKRRAKIRKRWTRLLSRLSMLEAKQTSLSVSYQTDASVEKEKTPHRPVVTQLGSFCRFTVRWLISQTGARSGRGPPVSNLLVGRREVPLEPRHRTTNHFHKPCEPDCGGPIVPCAVS